jgi:hypothetical protein
VVVAVGSHDPRALTDDFADLGPPASVPVQERDPSMPERVRRKVCHPRISTRPPNGHAETVGGHAIEEGYSCVAVLPGREPFDDYVEQVIGKFDPPRTTGLGHGGAYEPRFPAFVQITDAGGLQLANTDSGRVEEEEADEVLRGQKPGSGLDRIVRGTRSATATSSSRRSTGGNCGSPPGAISGVGCTCRTTSGEA